MNAASMTQRLVQYSPELEAMDAYANGPKNAVARQFEPNAESFNEGPVMEFAAEQRLQVLARWALPFAGRSLGVLHNPKTMAAAAQIFGLELEGLSPEDKEFELTRSFVRLAADAVRHAAALPPSVPPKAIASRAATEAARHWAPGLLGAGVPRDPGCARGRS